MEIRIDKWLWAVRIFKTRSKASEACKSGKVSVDGCAAKQSRALKPGEIVDVSFPPITRNFRVKKLAVKRVSAKLAKDLVEEITPEKEMEKLRLFHTDPVSIIFGHREKGAGRPTKKERRYLDKLKERK